jgi:hypothetical protein
MAMPQSLEERDRAVHVRRAFHVEPQEVPGGHGLIRDLHEVAKAHLDVLVETELRWFHRDHRVETRRFHLVDHPQVVVRDFVRLLDADEVFTEPREDRADACRRERSGGFEGVLEPFARHELDDRPADEARAHRALAQPHVR